MKSPRNKIRDVVVGGATVPWNDQRKGWILPGCEVTADRDRAHFVASKLSRIYDKNPLPMGFKS